MLVQLLKKRRKSVSVFFFLYRNVCLSGCYAVTECGASVWFYYVVPIALAKFPVVAFLVATAHPGLDADEGCLLAFGRPDAQDGGLVEGDAEDFIALFVLQDCLLYLVVFEDDGALFKEGVGKWRCAVL